MCGSLTGTSFSLKPVMPQVVNVFKQKNRNGSLHQKRTR
jgi:hypothetical protein